MKPQRLATFPGWERVGKIHLPVTLGLPLEGIPYAMSVSPLQDHANPALLL